jgi:hypothetical protein
MCREIDNDGYPEGNIHGTTDVDSYTLGDGHCRNGVASYRFIRGSANATAGNSASADATTRGRRAGSSSSAKPDSGCREAATDRGAKYTQRAHAVACGIAVVR